MEKQFESIELLIIETALEAYINKMMDWREEDLKKGDKTMVICNDVAIMRVKELKEKVTNLKKEVK